MEFQCCYEYELRFGSCFFFVDFFFFLGGGAALRGLLLLRIAFPMARCGCGRTASRSATTSPSSPWRRRTKPSATRWRASTSAACAGCCSTTTRAAPRGSGSSPTTTRRSRPTFRTCPASPPSSRRTRNRCAHFFHVLPPRPRRTRSMMGSVLSSSVFFFSNDFVPYKEQPLCLGWDQLESSLDSSSSCWLQK